MFWPALLLVWGINLSNVVFSALSCKDMDGKDVDWFIALKIPVLANRAESDFIKSGTAFFYADVNNQEFRMSDKNINDPKSAIGMTVSQAIDAAKSTVRLHCHNEPNETVFLPYLFFTNFLG